jgi:hypothetical protein
MHIKPCMPLFSLYPKGRMLSLILPVLLILIDHPV